MFLFMCQMGCFIQGDGESLIFDDVMVLPINETSSFHKSGWIGVLYLHIAE